MACSYCESPMDRCKCRYGPRGFPYRSRKRTPDYTRSTWDEKLSRRSTCQKHFDPYESRSKSRSRHYSSHRPSFCEDCEEEVCQCDHASPIYEDNMPLECSRHDRDPCRLHNARIKSKHDAHKSSEDTEQTLRIQLFEAKKKEKKYEDATEMFRDALACDKSRGSSDKMLKLMASFADMQVIRGNCNEAERILDDIYRWKNLPSGLHNQCSSIRGRILCARKRYTEAENLYRELYDRASKDPTSLEMGDEMCNAIALQGDLDRAHIEQTILLEKRKRILGAGHSATVKNAIKAVENIRKLIQKLPRDNGSTEERSLKRKQALESDIEYLLRDIWMSLVGNTQMQEVDSLKIGFNLGMSLSNQKKFYEAEPVLAEVWRGRKAKLGELNIDSMSSGVCLGQAMYRQEFDGLLYCHDLGKSMYNQQLGGVRYNQDSSREQNLHNGCSKCQTAASIFMSIFSSGRNQAYGDDNSIIKVAGAHLGVVCARLGDHEAAQHLLMNTMSFAPTGGVPMPPTNLMHFALEQARLKQHTVWDPQSKSSRRSARHEVMAPGTLMARGLTIGASSTQASNLLPWPATASNRLAIMSGSSNAHSGLVCGSGQGENFYRTALLQGRRYMTSKDYETAAMILAQAWNQPTAVRKEMAVRAKCGDKYGVCLGMLGNEGDAVRVLKGVQALKKQLYPGQPNRERRRTGFLIRRIEDRDSTSRMDTWLRSTTR